MSALQGRNEINGKIYRAVRDMVITAKQGFVEVSAMDVLKHIAFNLNYKVETIEEGPLPVGDIETLEKFLERFSPSDTVEVSTFENKIIIERASPYKKASLPAASLEAIASKDNPVMAKLKQKPDGFYELGKSSYNLKFTLNVEDIQRIIEDGDLVQQRVYPWHIKDKTLFVSVGSTTYGQIETAVPLEGVTPEQCPEVKTAFSAGIDNLFGSLAGKVSLQLAAEFSPLIVEQSTDKYGYLAVLVPYKE